MPEQKFWQTDSFWSIIKQCAGALIILAILFGVLRPMLKTLTNNKSDEDNQKGTMSSGTSNDKEAHLKRPTDYESQLSLLREVVEKEPKRVAQVVKTWVERG